MKNLFLLCGLIAGVWANANSSVDRELEDCRGDNTCMSKVLAELIEKGSNDNNAGESEYIEFYHDDGRCELSNLIKRVRYGISEAGCRTAAGSIRDRVWGIKVDGRCSDISDLDFIDACLRYASSAKSKNPK